MERDPDDLRAHLHHIQQLWRELQAIDPRSQHMSPTDSRRREELIARIRVEADAYIAALEKRRTPPKNEVS